MNLDVLANRENVHDINTFMQNDVSWMIGTEGSVLLPIFVNTLNLKNITAIRSKL